MHEYRFDPAWTCAAVSGALTAMLMGWLLAIRFPRWAPFQARLTRLAQLGYDRRRLAAWVWALLLTDAAFAALGLATLSIDLIVVGGAGLLVVLLGRLLRRLIEQRERRLRNQLCDAASAIAGALAAGTAPALAVEEAAHRTPQPLQRFLAKVTADYRRGMPLAEALQITERGLALDSFSLVSSAVSAALARGGRLTESLSRIADGLHQQQALDDKLAALTASGRKAMATMSVFPMLFAGMFYSLDPYGYDLVLASPTGQALTVLAMATMFISMRWAKAILDAVT